MLNKKKENISYYTIFNKFQPRIFQGKKFEVGSGLSDGQPAVLLPWCLY